MMLEVENLHAYYGQSHILHGVDLNVGDGEIVSLLGRNGVGRSTACKAIMGLLPAQGTIRFKGEVISGLRPDQIAHCGIGYVPEDRQIFPTLTVRQNLELGLKRAGQFGRWTFDDVYKLFPNLGARQDVSEAAGGIGYDDRDDPVLLRRRAVCPLRRVRSRATDRPAISGTFFQRGTCWRGTRHRPWP